MVIDVLAQAHIVYLDVVDAIRIQQSLVLLTGEVALECVKGGHELGRVDISFLQTVLVFEELLCTYGLFYAAESDLTEGVLRVSADVSTEGAGTMGGFKNQRVLGSIGELNIVEEEPLVDVLRVLRVAVELSNSEDVRVLHDLEVSEEVNEDVSEVVVADLLLVVCVEILEVIHKLHLRVSTEILDQDKVVTVDFLGAVLESIGGLQIKLKLCIAEVYLILAVCCFELFPGVLIQQDMELLENVAELVQRHLTLAEAIILTHDIMQAHFLLSEFLL